MNPALSIVIVNYNVKYFLDQCLKSIFRSNYSYLFEVIVVDNASEDGSRAFVQDQFPEVIWIQNNENVGFSKANNQGIRVAGGRYILLLNPDTILSESTLEKCFSFMEAHPAAGALGVRMYDGSGRYLPESKRGLPTPWVSFFKLSGLSRLFPRSSFLNKYHLGNLDPNEDHEVEILSGAFMMVRSEAFHRAGLLDEDFFMYGEDIDLSYRIAQAGYKIWYLGSCSIIHFKGESTRKATYKYYKVFYKAMQIFAEKHFGKSRSWLYGSLLNLGIILRGIVGFIWGTLKKWFRPVLTILILIFSFGSMKYLWGFAYHGDPKYFPDSFLLINLPIYIGCHLIALYLSGYFHKVGRIRPLFSGMIAGLLLSLLIYALLPEVYRSSRMLPFLGSLLALFMIWAMDRLFFNKDSTQSRRVLLVGDKNEIERAEELLEGSMEQGRIVGHVGDDLPPESKNLGRMTDIRDVVRAYSVTDLIFCKKENNFHEELTLLKKLGNKVSFKWFSENAVAVIGSQSKMDRGEIYTREIRYKIADPYRRDLKKLIDKGVGLFVLLLSPILWWVGKGYRTSFTNSVNVLLGKKTMLGYLPGDPYEKELPALPEGVFAHYDYHVDELNDPDKIHRLNFLYAVEYAPLEDLVVILRKLVS